jgi:hypothetical protein
VDKQLSVESIFFYCEGDKMQAKERGKEKDTATKTLSIKVKGTENRSIVDTFKRNVLQQGRKINQFLIELMAKENKHFLGENLEEQPTEKTLRCEHNGKSFLEIVAPYCIGKPRVNNGETFVALNNEVPKDYEKFRALRLAALKAGAVLVTDPRLGFLLKNE